MKPSPISSTMQVQCWTSLLEIHQLKGDRRREMVGVSIAQGRCLKQDVAPVLYYVDAKPQRRSRLPEAVAADSDKSSEWSSHP